MWTHIAPTLLLTITVLTKTSLTLKAACGLERFVQLTSREEPVIWENHWEGKKKKREKKFCLEQKVCNIVTERTSKPAVGAWSTGLPLGWTVLEILKNILNVVSHGKDLRFKK